MKQLLAGLMFAGSCLAAPIARIAPLGPWTLCPTQEWACGSTSKFWYVVWIDNSTTDPESKVFIYTLTAKLKGVEKPVVIRMALEKNDNGYGNSVGTIYVGGEIEEGVATIEVKSYKEIEEK